MGEQSSEAEEAAQYNPFLRRSVPFSVTDRLQMADEISSTRKIAYSSHLREIITKPENFYQQGQQSAKMAEDAHRRNYESFNTRREAVIQQKRSEHQPLPAKIGMIEINPTRVTLSLEFESQYYHLMTNEYGEHENIASIMAETNTLIQLPDQLCDSPNSDPLVQQVTITGRYNDVDKARKLMRENCHVSVFMSLSEVKISAFELESIVHQNSIPNVEMQFFNTNHGQYHLCFTSRSKNEKQLIEATNTILEKAFDGESKPVNQFSLHFTLSTCYVEHVVGQPSTTLLMPQIESRTKTKITYPTFNVRDDINSNIFEIVIVGETKNVLEARKCIIELLPISICFNIKNTDMAAPSKKEDRRIHAMLEEERTMIKVTPSMYEPAELLSGEVALHCGSLRSKEFNIKNLYAAYQKVLSEKIDVVAPQPDDYDNSIWHLLLPKPFFSFVMQCRGEAPDSAVHIRRNRTTSVASCRSKRSHSNKGKIFSESSGVDPKSLPRIPQTLENPAVPLFMPFAHFGAPVLLAPMMKGLYPIQPQVYLPEYYVSHMNAAYQFGPPISEVEQMQMLSSEMYFRQQQAQRKNVRSGTRNAPTLLPNQQIPNFPRPPRIYEQVKEEDARSSTRSLSRRTSVSGDEPIVGSYEDRSHDRQFHRQYQKIHRDEPVRWKTGKGDLHSKRSIPMQKEFRENQDSEHHVGSYGSSELASTEHLQFQMTHHLKLKQNDVDFDQERLFMHDNSLNDDTFFPSRNYATTLNSSFEHGRRSRAGSAIEKDDISRYTDSECGYSGEALMAQQSRSIENYKKGPPGVTKTMLEPRCRTDKNYSKISLEHRGKYFNEHPANVGKYAESGSFGTRMDPMKLIASVHESSEQLPIINERKFSDVLNDKERELAASSLRELSNDSSSLVQDPSFDESSSMNYAFRTEKSSENLQ